MSEWVSVFAVFWVLWAVDGARFGRRRLFTFIAAPWKWTCGLRYARLSLPGFSPWSWRIVASDVPLSLSPLGVCNQPAGAAGRPAETPERVQAWRWNEIREAGIAAGSLYVNGARFCAHSGHLTAAQLLALAALPSNRREREIRRLIARWFRVGTLRRRQRVLVARTRLPAALNGLALAMFVALTAYVAADLPARLPGAWSERIAGVMPALLLTVFVVHVAAVGCAFRAVSRLRAVAAEKRGSHLFSALLLPPQALRLRGVLGEGFFPAQHPLAVALALDRGPDCAFRVLADLRWPLPVAGVSAAGSEILAWFRTALEAEIAPRLAGAGSVADDLLAAPRPDTPASCSYCPRCRDQFVAGPATCPHGIALRPLRR